MAKANKAAPQQATVATPDWEQVIVAEEGGAPEDEGVQFTEVTGEEPTPEALELLEPAPFTESTPEELSPLPDLSPLEETPPEALGAPEVLAPAQVAPIVEPGLQPFVKMEGTSLILKEPYLAPDQKLDVERRITRGKKVHLKERKWVPFRPETQEELGPVIDALETPSRYSPKSLEWLKRSAAERRAALRGLEQIPANIIAKRIVYETEGGFTVEVTYSEHGQTLHKFFTVPDLGDPKKTLDSVRSGRWAQATAVSDELIEALGRTAGRRSRVPPGKVHTWPIENRHPVWTIHGISQKLTAHLSKINVHTIDHLRVRSPVVLARHCRVPVGTARKWQWEAELVIVKGLHRRFAHILVAAGVRGLDHLQRTKPDDVMELANKWLQKHATTKGPKRIGKARAASWIKKARLVKKRMQPFPA